jgi:hypothetical protein
MHEIDPKESGSPNLSFLAFKGTELASLKFRGTTKTARDRRKKLSLKLFLHKMFKKTKISMQKYFSPHFPHKGSY